MMPPRTQKSLIYIFAALLARSKFGSSFLRGPVANLSAKNLRESPRRTPFRSRAATSAAGDAVLVPPGVLGPPEPLRSLEVGQHVDAFRVVRCEEGTEKLQFAIERVARAPDVFRLGNFLTESECARIKSAAEMLGMEEAGTVTKEDGTSRKNCSVAWISSDGRPDAGAVGDLAASTANILLSREVLSQPSAGVEDLQVLRYGAGGEFVHHHDGEPRILTVIYYVNGVGGTWFPLARTDDENATGDLCEEPKNKARALDLTKGLGPGEDGLLVKGVTRNAHSDDADNDSRRGGNGHVVWVNRGDAIAFYNYKDDGSGQLDWRALHCGLPTTEEEGTKWIANHWYRLNSLADIDDQF